MAFCSNCGNEYENGLKSCPNCGAENDTAFAENEEAPAKKKAEDLAEYDEKDISENRNICVFAYLGPLVLIPLFARKNSKFARFHTNQGLALLIVDTAYAILQRVLLSVFSSNAIFAEYPHMLGSVLTVIWIILAALSVIGIMNAVKGRASKLPLTGNIKLLK